MLLVFGLVAIIGFQVMDDFNNQYQDTDASNTSKAQSQTFTDRYVNLWDGIFMLVFGLLGVALVISVATLGTRPEFFFITIIVGMFIVGGAAALSNVFTDATDGMLASSAAQFTFLPLIMNNLVNITLFLVFALVVGLFVKARGIV